MEARGFEVVRVSRSADKLDVRDPASVKRVLGGLEGPFGLVFVAIGTLAAGGAPEKSLARQADFAEAMQSVAERQKVFKDEGILK